MRLRIFPLLFVLVGSALAEAPANLSALVRPGADGRLVYTAFSERGDRLPDFSQAGYGGGGVPLPLAQVVAELDAKPGDNRERIQAAIDAVSALPLGPDGLRGALLLHAGRYEIDGTIAIDADGVVLRGAGSGTNGTVLIATKKEKHNLLEIGGQAQAKALWPTTAHITDDYVPVGAREFHVDHSGLLKVGDRVFVRRAGNAAWISAIGMDRIPARPDGQPVEQWKPDTQDLLFDRQITAIQDDLITIDVPLTDPINRDFGGGRVYRYTYDERRGMNGVESIRFESHYDPSVTGTEHAGPVTLPDTLIDEAHGWNAIMFNAARDGWARNLVSVSFANACVNVGRSALRLTVEDCAALAPVSRITGDRRYAFPIAGQQILVRRCHANRARHAFVLDSRVPGPNVYLDCEAVENYDASEPHHRWASGALWDNVSVTGSYAWLEAINRGWLGSGHGWAGAQMVFWNCQAPVIAAQKPPHAQNFIIGVKAPASPTNHDLVKIIVGDMNYAAGTDLPPSSPTWGDGYIESPQSPVSPRSLYEAQLADRLAPR